MITPTFTNTSDADMPIDSYIVIGVEDMEATAQIVNPDGTWGTQYLWFNEYVDPDTGDVTPAGWLDINYSPAGISLKPGQSVFFYTAVKNVKVQSAGQVSGKIEYPVATGYNMIGNGSPVNLPIDNMSVVGVADMEATAQLVNPDGTWGTQYLWFNEYVDPDTGDVTPAGWLDINYSPAGVTLDPGQSVFFYTAISNVKVIIPSAL